jgi:hypothetical protein
MPSSRLLRDVALVRTEVSEGSIATIIRATRIGELGTLAVTSNRVTLPRNYFFGSYNSHMAYTSQKTAFFMVTAVEISNLA